MTLATSVEQRDNKRTSSQSFSVRGRLRYGNKPALNFQDSKWRAIHACRMHKCPKGKNTQINRNERYGTVKQQNVASMSSAKQKAKGFAARNDKRTRILAKQAILRELTRDTDLLIKAHGVELKQRDETDDTGVNPYGQPQCK